MTLSFQGKIPVRVHPLFFLMAVLIGVLSSQGQLAYIPIAVLVIFISILVHEYGHALTALYFGQRARIDLIGLGGLTSREGIRLKLWQNFLVVLNGPLAGLLLAMIAYTVLKYTSMHPLLKFTFLYALWINLFWTAVNLLPIQPLDGGQLMSIVLEGIFGVRGVKMSIFISLALSCLVSFFFFFKEAFLPGSIFLLFAFESYRSWNAFRHLSREDRDENLLKMIKQAEELADAGKLQDALIFLKAIREKAKRGLIYISATQLLGKIHYRLGNRDEAFTLLQSMKRNLSPDMLNIYHTLCCERKQWKEAAEVGDEIYRNFPNFETAERNALAQAALKNKEAALGWLYRAKGDGAPNLKDFIQKEPFRFIEEGSGFPDDLISA